MATKQSKKQIKEQPKEIIETPEQVIEKMKQDYAKLVAEIHIAKVNIESMEKKHDEMLHSLWEKMNKYPSHTIIDEDIKSVKSTEVVVPEVKKPKGKSKVEDTTVEPTKSKVETVEPTKTKVELVEPTKSKAKGKEKITKQIEVEEVKPTKITKGKKSQPFDNSPKPDELVSTTPSIKKPAGKITAPPKGTPKPKLENESDEEVINMKPTDISSDSELSSASNISDDSDASGGDDD